MGDVFESALMTNVIYLHLALFSHVCDVFKSKPISLYCQWKYLLTGGVLRCPSVICLWFCCYVLLALPGLKISGVFFCLNIPRISLDTDWAYWTSKWKVKVFSESNFSSCYSLSKIQWKLSCIEILIHDKFLKYLGCFPLKGKDSRK